MIETPQHSVYPLSNLLQHTQADFPKNEKIPLYSRIYFAVWKDQWNKANRSWFGVIIRKSFLSHSVVYITSLYYLESPSRTRSICRSLGLGRIIDILLQHIQHSRSPCTHSTASSTPVSQFSITGYQPSICFPTQLCRYIGKRVCRVAP